MKRSPKRSLLGIILVLAVGAGLFAGGYTLSNQLNAQRPVQTTKPDKDYYVSFDDYYYEIPKQKVIDDKLVPGGQFIYGLNISVKTNTLDDLFNAGAIGVQALFPFDEDNQAFERYLDAFAKPAAASAFQGTADLTFSERGRDKVKTADLDSKDSQGQVVRKQHMVNLPQSVALVAKGESDAFKALGESVGQASVKFDDYNDIKIQVLAQSFMLKNRMFDDLYRLAHQSLRDATSVGELNTIADKSKEMFALETKVSGVSLTPAEMSATVHFIDAAKPANNKTCTMTFRQADGKWQLFGLKTPGGSVTGATSEDAN